MAKKISVGIADMKIARQEGELITYALGSCIGIAFYDPMIKLGALLHIMLPEKNQSDTNAVRIRRHQGTACGEDCGRGEDV